MKARKSLIMFLALSLCLALTFALGISAHDEAEHAEGKILGMETFNFVSLCVLAAVLVAAIVFCIIKRKKVVESARAYKSEMKKITWFPWKSVWRSTVLVLVVVVIAAVVIGLLDFAFFEGQYLLTGQGRTIFGGN